MEYIVAVLLFVGFCMYGLTLHSKNELEGAIDLATDIHEYFMKNAHRSHTVENLNVHANLTIDCEEVYREMQISKALKYLERGNLIERYPDTPAENFRITRYGRNVGVPLKVQEIEKWIIVSPTA